MKSLVLIAHDIRSTHNVGSLLRTADGLGVEKVYLTGYTPYPLKAGDTRLPHIAQKLDAAIKKTALGAETSVHWEHVEDVYAVIKTLQSEGYNVMALEQTASSKELHNYTADNRTVLVLGSEVTGMPSQLLEACNETVQIPMLGAKESFNVVQAAAMALFQLRFH